MCHACWDVAELADCHSTDCVIEFTDNVFANSLGVLKNAWIDCIAVGDCQNVTAVFTDAHEHIPDILKHRQEVDTNLEGSSVLIAPHFAIGGVEGDFDR